MLDPIQDSAGSAIQGGKPVSNEMMPTDETGLWEMIGQAGSSPICAFDAEFRLTVFNQAHSDEFFRIFGYRVQSGEIFPDLFPPEQAPIIRGFMARALAGETFNVVEEFGDPDLDRPYWEIAYAPLCDASGAIVGAFHEARDITARLRAESRLSETRLQFAAHAGRMGLWELDLKTLNLVTSSVCKENFGRSVRDPFTYDDLRASVHSDDQERMRAAVATSLATGADYDIEYRINRADGLPGWVHIRAQVLEGQDGQPERMAGVSVNITDRKQAELRAEVLIKVGDHIRDFDDPAGLAFAAAETLGRALGVSRAGYGVVDLQRETITIERDWNAPGVTSLAGVLNFRDYGSYIEDLKRGDIVVFADANTDPRTAATAGALKAISALSVVNMPVTEQRGLAALLYLNNAEPRDWSQDELDLIRTVAERVRTATARLQAEKDLRALAASLEAQVEERTAAQQVVEEQLRQSQKMEAIGQLTGGLAHDFNNLLAVITGSLDLLTSRVAQGRFGDLERFVTAAQTAGKRAAALTHRLLAFSRRQTLDPKPTDVNRLVTGMDDLIRRTVGPQITVEVVGAAGLWTTLVDPPQLENALLNLCINARDAMQDGGRLTIETGNKWLDLRTARERDLAPGQYVSMCVSDTGCGMTPDVIAKAFDPFFTTKPLGQGTGLGLSMIYGFARQSGGQVRIYSEIGQGAMVCVYLPRHYGAEEIEEAGSAIEAPQQASAGQTVLVVDDEPGIRMLVTDVLEDFGYHAIEASDGPSAMKVLQSNVRIDLLVTDVGMPGGMNGRQLADAARVVRPDLKVLFITGYAENAAIANGHLDPGMSVITKPFAVDDLASRIREMVSAASPQPNS